VLAGRQSFSTFVSGMAWKVYCFSTFVSGMAWKVYCNIFKICVDKAYKLMYHQTCVKPTKTEPFFFNMGEKCLGHITLKCYVCVRVR
jgi:hypothetical protein